MLRNPRILVLNTITKGECRAVLALVDINILKPHERTIEERVRLLENDIRKKRVLLKPILVDANTMVILDGHHRVEALRRLGARYIAALLVDYEDSCVSVSSWRPGWTITKSTVIQAALSGKLFPPRTSRHRLCFKIPSVHIHLNLLRGEDSGRQTS